MKFIEFSMRESRTISFSMARELNALTRSAEQRKEIAGGIRNYLASMHLKEPSWQWITHNRARGESATKFSPEYARLIKDSGKTKKSNKSIENESRQ